MSKRKSVPVPWDGNYSLSLEHREWLKNHRHLLGPDEPSPGPPSLHPWKEEEIGQSKIDDGAGIRFHGKPRIGPDGLRFYLVSHLCGCDPRNARRRLLAPGVSIPIVRWKERYATPYLAHLGTLPESDNPVLIPAIHADEIVRYLKKALRRRENQETYTHRLANEILSVVKVPSRGESRFQVILRDVRMILQRIGARKNRHGEYIASRSSTKQVLGRFYMGFGARREADERLRRFLRVPRKARDHAPYSAVCNWKATAFPLPRTVRK